MGKIGNRLDLELIVSVADALPDVRFVFAGPILDSDYRKPLESAANIELLGDVHYEDIPRLLQTFDIGWVPHNVGALEVGGDVLKTYEYRAAGLVVLSTPVAGAGQRGLKEVHVVARGGQLEWIRNKIASNTRVKRVAEIFSDDHTWEGKAEGILADLELKTSSF
ncbi:glycosyltransferase [Rhodococcus sp. NPDC060086]|uniref:glycosyltransferase n=1 Tax=Rhodococcus sp. NPDC060086 TaxID=3347055 RepID=UPI00365EDBC4